ncbi:KamA family radical SAM protein [Streptomyces justiciae]|uniref:KamA family radical SAM protein n=1 Tax=Streptomyces justiciae TaxID=2780140 RepID=A0ABU3LV89_9ACTN|nr:KamA family radical SAM protein [Streptomyces justiciae]MDT7843152.1 KamA family radical SAM protein [Streptomyces justiciae]
MDDNDGRRTAPARVIRDPEQIAGLPRAELAALRPVLAEFEFRVSPYYASLVDWGDPADPLRRLVLPDAGELGGDFSYDASDEAANTHVPGLQHKYPRTALLLLTGVCAAYCRFCFRKRFTLAADDTHHISAGDDGPETRLDVSAGIDYIRRHQEIDNVLLTGGDPLMLSPARLDRVLEALCDVPHVRTVRIGTKVPAFDPDRLTTELFASFDAVRRTGRRVVVVAHFNHSRELTPPALDRTGRLLDRGVSVINQTPVLRGVNDDPAELARLLNGLTAAGIAPYYLFQCRPVHGDESFQVSVQDTLRLLERTRPSLNGLARRFRYVASHARGKIEVLGQYGDELLFRFHEARDPADDGRVFTMPAAEPVLWPRPPVSDGPSASPDRSTR